jgi:hypothetical protein
MGGKRLTVLPWIGGVLTCTPAARHGTKGLLLVRYAPLSSLRRSFTANPPPLH